MANVKKNKINSNKRVIRFCSRKSLLPGLLVLIFLNSGFDGILAQKNTSSPIVHDPVMAKEAKTYYLFCTGWGIDMLSSPDLLNWKREKPVFSSPPDWAMKQIKEFKGHIWAPDISFHNGLYYLYYSVSAFGKNTSSIGLATNKTLDPQDKEYKWEDHGEVIQSVPGRDMWNAIDPNLIIDENGIPWLTFGSFWNGIKLVRLSADLKSIQKNPEEWYTLCSRPRNFELEDRDPGDGAVEAPFIFKKDSLYYLFTSFDYCCRGINSNYKIMVGRSAKVTGPYIDKEGKRMDQGGGSLVLKGNENYPGLGHNSVYTFDGKDYIVFHAYDAKDGGKPKLIIKEFSWDKNGWPSVQLE
jgi:arabinan endo-1,5-alpha-L-arabinosidase